MKNTITRQMELCSGHFVDTHKKEIFVKKHKQKNALTVKVSQMKNRDLFICLFVFC